MSLNYRQLVAAALVVGVALVVGFIIPKDYSMYLVVVGIAGAVGVFIASAGSQPQGLAELPSAIASLERGERARLPENASPPVARLFEQVSALAERANNDDLAPTLQALRAAMEQAAEGRRPAPPKNLPDGAQALWDDLSGIAEAMKAFKQADGARAAALTRTTSKLDETIEALSDGLSDRGKLAQDASRTILEVSTNAQDLARHVDTLAATAETSAASIVQMTATNDEVATNVGELATSVRDTASSIEEMAYSIKEVAKNVDALSLTAEETSSSMNEMDVSIDQVQSNANETARLSEEVAQDAERGAEAILKTIGEIYRIKESTQEAVAVISNLGSRIEAIGQILNVIDDVAEQTNLLALNAAIIAAQAGEHGKGFAVVADEIKDLAERAGASTKEIAELTKTIQNESKNAIVAVERGAKNVDRGVEVSNEAEHALKKILESSQKSTNMVRAIARATVEQAKGSRQVTDAIGRIAETVQQIAAATAEQARGSELIMRSVERMRSITQQVERSSQDQARGGRDVTVSMESITSLLGELSQAHRALARSGDALISSAERIEQSISQEAAVLRQLSGETLRLRDVK